MDGEEVRRLLAKEIICSRWFQLGGTQFIFPNGTPRAAHSSINKRDAGKADVLASASSWNTIAGSA